MKNYVCGICGSKYEGLDDYLACVSKCGEILKAEAESKRLIKMNENLNKIKEAMKSYEELLAKFKEEYPEEYKLNFESMYNNCPHDCKGISSDNKEKSVKVLYEEKNDEEPNIRVRVNGKDVAAEKLFEDPDCRYISKLLGLI